LVIHLVHTLQADINEKILPRESQRLSKKSGEFQRDPTSIVRDIWAFVLFTSMYMYQKHKFVLGWDWNWDWDWLVS